jgi:MFS family permease
VLAGGGLAYAVRRAFPDGDPGDAALLGVAALGYLAAAALVTRLPVDKLGPDPDDELDPHTPTPGWHAVAEGAAHVRQRPKVLHALVVVGISRFGYGLTTIATILLCRNHFNDPADVDAGLELLASVFAASAVGFALAAVATPLASERWGTTGWIWRCLLLGAVAELMVLAKLTVPVALVAAALLGFAVQGLKICVDATVQRDVHDEFRGRVFAVYDVVFNVAFVVAASCAALVVPQDGFAPSLWLFIAVMFIASAAGYGHASRRLTQAA